MPLYPFQGHHPRIGKDCFIAPSADLIGKVSVGDRVSIWFQTVVRGDVSYVEIGDETNIQDSCLLHVGRDVPLIIGEKTSIAHRCIIHACTIGKHSLIGMGAIIMDGAEIGENCLVAAGSLIPPGKKYPPHSFIMGTPAVVKRELTPEECEYYAKHYLNYQPLREEYLKGSGS